MIGLVSWSRRDVVVTAAGIARRSIRSSAVVVAMVLAGCGSSAPPAAPDATVAPATSAAAPTTSTSPPATPPLTTPPALTTSTTTPAASSVVLRSDGLSVARLGDPGQPAVDALVEALGPPTLDEGQEWVDVEVGIHEGFPVDSRFRRVVWDDLGLTVIGSDGVRWPDDRDETLIHWSYVAPPEATLRLATDRGVTTTTPGAELLAAYGDELTVLPPSEFAGWTAALPSAHPEAIPLIAGLVFELSGDPADPGTEVIRIWAGAAQAP